MITQLPRWVWAGSWLLALVAGMVNVIGFIGFAQQATTHLTGTTSMLGAAIADADLAQSMHFAALLTAFVLGCAISGFIIQDSTLRLGRRYGVALLLVSAMLFLATPLLWRHSAYGMYLAACACGLQNAMVSAYSGAVVRTTHVSGMFTDLGIYLGHVLRGMHVDQRRLRLCVLVISGFLTGGIVGALAFREWSYSAMLLPAGLIALLAMIYAVYRRRSLLKPSR